VGVGRGWEGEKEEGERARLAEGGIRGWVWVWVWVEREIGD